MTDISGRFSTDNILQMRYMLSITVADIPVSLEFISVNLNIQVNEHVLR